MSMQNPGVNGAQAQNPMGMFPMMMPMYPFGGMPPNNGSQQK